MTECQRAAFYEIVHPPMMRGDSRAVGPDDIAELHRLGMIELVVVDGREVWQATDAGRHALEDQPR